MDTLIQLGQERQSSLDRATQDFLRHGGKVQSFGQHETKPREFSIWRPTDTDRIDARKAASVRDSEMRRLLSDNACLQTEFGPVRLTAKELRNKMRTLGEPMTTPQIEQLCARFGIKLAEGGRAS